ncbi:MAG TPA: hypothetical protein VKD00_07020 [Methyloceanibacter sp.]|nr:hypothetical protein [Methyloceanibacter sp.]
MASYWELARARGLLERAVAVEWLPIWAERMAGKRERTRSARVWAIGGTHLVVGPHAWRSSEPIEHVHVVVGLDTRRLVLSDVREMAMHRWDAF